MHVISPSALRKFGEKYPDAETTLRSWYKLATTAERSNLAEVKAVFSSVDKVGNFTVFNIGGNNYRLITFIDYEYWSKKNIRSVLTHKEYDEDKWKKDSWYE
jgi:mRNA interferase HigB